MPGGTCGLGQRRSCRAGTIAIGTEGAQARAQRAEIGVGRVVFPADACCGQRGAQPRRRDEQQRAQQADGRRLVEHGHAGQPRWSTGRERPHDHCLRLVGGMMAEQQVQDAGVAAGIEKRGVAGRPRPFGKGRAGGEPGQRQDARIDAPFGQPRRDRRCLLPGLRPQAMVHDQRQQRAAAPAHPGVRQQRQRRAVRPAGNRGGEPRRRLERPQWRHQRSEIRISQWFGHAIFAPAGNRREAKSAMASIVAWAASVCGA